MAVALPEKGNVTVLSNKLSSLWLPKVRSTTHVRKQDCQAGAHLRSRGWGGQPGGRGHWQLVLSSAATTTFPESGISIPAQGLLVLDWPQHQKQLGQFGSGCSYKTPTLDVNQQALVFSSDVAPVAVRPAGRRLAGHTCSQYHPQHPVVREAAGCCRESRSHPDNVKSRYCQSL